MLTVSWQIKKEFVLDDTDEYALSVMYTYNEKISAIKFIRARYAYGLKDAKDVVDAYWDNRHCAGVKQHWSTKHISESDATRCYNCHPKYPEEIQNFKERKTVTLGDLLRDKLER
jgi:hypothetical protein